MYSRVDLPLPDLPIMVRNSPLLTWKDMLLSTLNSTGS